MMWDVQDILAARTSVTGDDEVLVVWKPSWIPFSNVQAGPVLQRFQAATQWPFTSGHCGMRIILPVEPHTTLAVDHAVMQEMMAAARSEERRSRRQATATATDRLAPRKSLGTVAKRRRQTITGDTGTDAIS
jgi:hypothetical protein